MLDLWRVQRIYSGFYLPPGQDRKAQRRRDDHDQRPPVVHHEGQPGQQHVTYGPGQAADHSDTGPVTCVDPLDACEGGNESVIMPIIQR